MLKTSGKPGLAQVWHLPEMVTSDRNRIYGLASVKMADVLTAGEMTSITFQFEIGETKLPTGGRLRIGWRWPIDWSDLQCHDPEAEGSMRTSVIMRSSDQCPQPEIKPVYHQMSDMDPWMHCIDLILQTGQLMRGDRVHLVCGDHANGSPGWRAPTLRINGAHFLMLINPDNSDRWFRLTDPPAFTIKAGPPHTLVASTSADGLVGSSFELLLRAEDRWGNASPIGETAPDLTLIPDSESTTSASMAAAQTTTVQDSPVGQHILSIDQPGIYRIAASVPELSLETQSNPIHVFAERPQHRLFWGDLHSGQTEIGCGAGTLADHYRFARDVAGLQFVTHQANDHYVTLPLWRHTREQTTKFNEPEKFVVFLGCEWSPPTVDGGDRNVIYRFDEPRLRRSGRFYTETDPDPEPDIPTASDFHAAFAGEQIMVNMHVGGRPTNLNYHAPHLEPLAEIHSTHGTSEWFVEDALNRGYKVGITAGADGVTGRPGADHPGWRLNRNVRSGLTAVYATELSKEALWEAFQARRCYGTTGERIRLWTEVDGHPMGSSYATSGQPQVQIRAEGTAAIERVELLRGTQVICRWQIAAYESDLLRALWCGTRETGTARAQRLVWNGSLTATSGHFSAVDAVGFHSADDAIRLQGDSKIAWRSATAGNAAGFTFRWDGDTTARCSFHSDPCSFDFSRNQIQIDPLTVDAGFVKSSVQIGPAPKKDGMRRVDLTYIDTQPLPGETPYWVRIVQVDQARAWSSPVYVTY